MSAQPIRIDIFSDIACPWCYLGQKRMRLALESLEDSVDAEVNWKPFQLDPATPPEGYDAVEYLSAKLGGAEAVERSHKMLEDLGQQIGLPFNFAKRKRLYNTFDAHRLIHWGAEQGCDRQDQLVRDLFEANFVGGLNIADHMVLADLATHIGFDRNDILGRLKGDRDAEFVRTAIAAGHKMGITGVPCFVFEKQYAVSGAQEVNVLIGALQELADMKRQTPADEN